MNFDQLAGFVEVAQTRHFTRAAEHLNLAQPSLSRQISTLESELGVELFHRIRGNVTLTVAGDRLLPIARRLLADAESARSEMAELVGTQRGRVRLGATPTLCTSMMVEVLVEFQKRYPGIDIEIMERGSHSLITELMEGALDLALIVAGAPADTARAVLTREPILSERLVVVSSRDAPDPFGTDHEIVGRAVTLSELARVPQVVFPTNYDLRGTVDAAFKSESLAPTVAVAGAEMDAALRFAERGVGVAVVPAMVAMDRPNLRSAALASSAMVRVVSLARRSDMAPTHASAALQTVIHETADALTAPGAASASFVHRVS